MNALDLLGGVFFSPVRTLRTVAEKKPLGWAVGILVLLTLLPLVAEPEPLPEGVYGVEADQASALEAVTVVLSVLWPLAVLFVTHLIALAFKPGTLSGFVCAYAFAKVPSLLGYPLDLLATTGAAPLASILRLLLGLWLIVLHVVAVRESYGFRTGAAVLVSLLGVVGVTLLGGIAAVIFLLPVFMALVPG